MPTSFVSFSVIHSPVSNMQVIGIDTRSIIAIMQSTLGIQ